MWAVCGGAPAGETAVRRLQAPPLGSSRLPFRTMRTHALWEAKDRSSMTCMAGKPRSGGGEVRAESRCHSAQQRLKWPPPAPQRS